MTTQTASETHNSWPVSYPSLIVGSSGGDGFGTSMSNLPRKIGDLGSVPTGWSWSTASGKYNAAYDVWFNPNGADSGPGQRSFIMIWLHAQNGPQPAGTPVGTWSYAGVNWQIWEGTQHEGRPVRSYLAQSGPVTSLSFDLNAFIDHAVQNSNNFHPDLYLTNIFAGFEIWSGGQGLRTNNFCAEVH